MTTHNATFLPKRDDPQCNVWYSNEQTHRHRHTHRHTHTDTDTHTQTHTHHNANVTTHNATFGYSHFEQVFNQQQSRIANGDVGTASEQQYLVVQWLPQGLRTSRK